MQAKEWKSAVSMYRSHDLWDDAYRVSYSAVYISYHYCHIVSLEVNISSHNYLCLFNIHRLLRHMVDLMLLIRWLIIGLNL